MTDETPYRKRRFRGEGPLANQDQMTREEIRAARRDQARRRRMINRLLSWPDDAKPPRCPGKSKTKVQAFEEAGDFSHSAKDHYCFDCACGNNAGRATSHVGFGLCYAHERRLPAALCKQIADEHMNAIMQRDKSWLYSDDPDEYEQKVMRSAKTSKEFLDLTPEIVMLRARMVEMRRKLDNRNKPTDGEIVDTLEKLYAEAMELKVQGLPYGKTLSDGIRDLRTLLTTTLTEKTTGGRVIPMTDETVFKIYNDLAKGIASISRIKLQNDKDNICTIDELNVFFGSLMAMTKQLLDPETYKKWVKGVMDLPQPGGMAKNTGSVTVDG